MDASQQNRIRQEFGARLRSLRIQKGFSQEDLASACQLDRSYIGGVERGERNVSLVNIIRIASGLGVMPAELFATEGALMRRRQ